MSFRRELAKAVLAEVVSAAAEDRARRLRASARRDAPGLYRDAKRGAARVADEVADDPQPVVDLIEALWDRPNDSRSQRRWE